MHFNDLSVINKLNIPKSSCGLEKLTAILIMKCLEPELVEERKKTVVLFFFVRLIKFVWREKNKIGVINKTVVATAVWQCIRKLKECPRPKLLRALARDTSPA